MNEERDALLKRIYRLPAENFVDLALKIFNYQSEYNPVYKSFLKYLDVAPAEIKSIENIPCLPIQFFKTHQVKSGQWKAAQFFESSGTTGQTRSRHYLREEELYNKLAINNFETSYGPVENICFLALLPNYIDQGNSSLVYMVNEFIKHSKYPQSGFFLDNFHELTSQIQLNQNAEIPTILIGVSYALLDLANHIDFEFDNITIMETGGMKGKREEWSKDKLHAYLKKAYSVSAIHSEYGMTELLSQAYSKGDGIFQEGITMKIMIREISDPFENSKTSKSGVVNVIDLANLDTCSFIETEDLGVKLDDQHFRLLGRLDNADIRGCNLLVQ